MTEHPLTLDVHIILREMIEQNVRYFCDEYKISGELAYVVVQSLATSKIEEFKKQQ